MSVDESKYTWGKNADLCKIGDKKKGGSSSDIILPRRICREQRSQLRIQYLKEPLSFHTVDVRLVITPSV